MNQKAIPSLNTTTSQTLSGNMLVICAKGDPFYIRFYPSNYQPGNDLRKHLQKISSLLYPFWMFHTVHLH